MARLLVQTTLPHSRQRPKTFVRTNGSLCVSITAHPLLELPYGRYPRLLMAWVTTEAVRTREPVLQLGPSLSSFMAHLSQQLPEKALSESLGCSCGAIRGRLSRPQGLQALFPRRAPPGTRPLPRCPSRAGPRWTPAQALTLPYPKTSRTVISTCGKPGISTHKHSPSVRINSPPLATVTTHKLSPLPCSGSCRSLPVAARPAVEGALPSPQPGNPSGIPAPSTASTTVGQIEIDETEAYARARSSKQCQVIPARGASALAARHFPTGKCAHSRP